MKQSKKQVKGVKAWNICLFYENEEPEILTGHIYDYKQDAIDVYKETGLYKPEYRIIPVLITPIKKVEK